MSMPTTDDNDLNEDEIDLLVKILKIAEPAYSDKDIDIFKYPSGAKSVFYSLVHKLSDRYGFDEYLL